VPRGSIVPDPLGHDTLSAYYRGRLLIAASQLIFRIEETRTPIIVLGTIHTITGVRVAQVTNSSMLGSLLALKVPHDPPDRYKGNYTAQRRTHSDNGIRASFRLLVLRTRRTWCARRASVGRGDGVNAGRGDDLVGKLACDAIKVVDGAVWCANHSRERINARLGDISQIHCSQRVLVTIPPGGDLNFKSISLHL